MRNLSVKLFYEQEKTLKGPSEFVQVRVLVNLEVFFGKKKKLKFILFYFKVI